ncbi:D-tyrosyl-tRNA(Tyr) deacylase [Candidatus Aerophobetes bacterium]|uniref:D-aminoacyl-tRNA deacylase n=1 Tax=Aerophobetes bacterium TaxID=2030807 RepID=A0A2A4X5B6_UNCAE|nr:MAG: D-tyrosyl-tRNA(Tyr) deacylase [Candidatus Aerophobetes bacterium]
MKLVIQRVSQASVSVNKNTIASIGKGLLVLVGFSAGDEKANVNFPFFIKKCTQMRLFEDEAGKMNLSLKDIGGEILVVSQFTLCADLRSGNRPSFTTALEPTLAKELYVDFCKELENVLGQEKVQRGEFGADMQVALINDGPVTFYIE